MIDYLFFIALGLYGGVMLLILLGAAFWLAGRFKHLNRFKGGRR